MRQLTASEASNDEMERQRFESSWLKRGGDKTDLDRFPHGHIEAGSGNVGGSYICDIVQGHWLTWQAALKSKQGEV